ncbi:MAG: PorV/PorQ family protein [Elusimicrobia bacterium]|nr:PorV/PorQ family protein [Elusimicrobiota bacterium]
MKCLDAGNKKDFANSLIFWASRPYVLVLVLAFLLTPSARLAGALESGADFLNIGSGARPAAMSSAFTAVSNDANAIYYNPAGLAAVNTRAVSFMHADWLMDASYDFAALAVPFKNFSAAFSITRLDHGGFEARGADRRAAGGFKSSDLSVATAFSKTLDSNSTIGFTAKYIVSSIAGYRATAAAFDAGYMRKLSALGGLPLSLGVAVRNMGRGLKYAEQRDELPLTVSAGVSACVFDAMTLVFDVKRLVYDKETSFAVGSEYNMFGAMFLRGGYSNSLTGAGDMGNISGGAGIKFANVAVDYSFAPFGNFGAIKALSLNYKF